LNQFGRHQLLIPCLFEGEVQVFLELLRSVGSQEKSGSDAASQGQQLWRPEHVRQAAISTEDSKEKAFRVEADALEQSQFGQADRGDFLCFVDEQYRSQQR